MMVHTLSFPIGIQVAASAARIADCVAPTTSAPAPCVPRNAGHPSRESGQRSASHQTSAVNGIQSRKYELCQMTANGTLMRSPGRLASQKIWATESSATSTQKAVVAAHHEAEVGLTIT